MNFKQYIDKNPHFFNIPLSESKYFEKVVNQSFTHSRDLDGFENPVISAERPGESKKVRQYRTSIHRSITYGDIQNYISKLSRILSEGGVITNNKSKVLDNWISGNNLFFKGKKTSVLSFFYTEVLPALLEDPNALIVALPYDKDSELSPMLLNTDKSVSIEVKIIPSVNIVAMENSFYSYYGGKIKEGNWYWVHTNNEIIKYVPTTAKKNNKTVYREELWYITNSNKNNINQVGGIVSKSKDGSVKYLNSFIKGYYDFADTALASYNEWNALRIQHLHPIPVMSQIPCKTCSGTGKTVGANPTKCGSCSGTGNQMSFDPFDVYINPKNAQGLPIQFVAPPIEILREAKVTAFELLEKARKSIGLDLLQGTGVESGVSKALRLLDLNDMVSKVGIEVFRSMETLFHSIEDLLQPTVSTREYCQIIVPREFNIKTSEDMLSELNTAPNSLKSTVGMEYISNKYKNDIKTLKVYYLALQYCPILFMDEDVLLKRLDAGVYSVADIITKDNIVNILTNICKSDIKFVYYELDDIKSKLDAEIQNLIPKKKENEE